jgi:hypothetical protein
MKIDKNKHFMRLPVYLVVVYFLASIPITIYLAQNVTQHKQYAQSAKSYPSATPQYVSPTFNCLANACPTTNSNPTVYGGIISSAPSAPKKPTSPLTPSIDPCVSISSVSVQNYSVARHGDSGGGGFFDFILDIINLFLELFGYPTIGLGTPAPTSGSVVSPVPSNGSVIPTSGSNVAPSSKPCPTGSLIPTKSSGVTSPPISIAPSKLLYALSTPTLAASASPKPVSPLTPSIDPCVSTSSVSVQNYSVARHGDRGGDGFFDFIMDIVDYFFKIILELIGYLLVGSGTPIPTSGSVVSPAPSSKPCPTGSLIPTKSSGVTSPPISIAPTTIKLTPTPTIASGTGGGTNVNVRLTFYTGYETGGFPEGNYIAEPVLHQRAGGTGTFADPLTFAAKKGAYEKGTKIYVPSVQKYFVREDLCSDSDPNCTGTQVDLYLGNPSNTTAAHACAIALTSPVGATNVIVINPSDGLTYDSKPIWSQSGGCMTLH